MCEGVGVGVGVQVGGTSPVRVGRTATLVAVKRCMLAEMACISPAANASKSDRTPDTFTPATAGGRCRYAETFATIAGRYHLPVTWLENWHLRRDLRSCQD